MFTSVIERSILSNNISVYSINLIRHIDLRPWI